MKLTKSKLNKIIQEEILREMMENKRLQQLKNFFSGEKEKKEMTSNERLSHIRQSLADSKPIPFKIEELNSIELDLIKAHLPEIDLKHLASITKFFLGEDIPTLWLRNMTGAEKDYLAKLTRATPGARKSLLSSSAGAEFPFHPVWTIQLAWRDFVEEEKLREIPDLKEKIENHGPEMGYQNRLHLGKKGSIYTGKGGDYLYDHIRRNKLLPKLKAKMFDYLKKYTNPSQIPKRLTLKRGIDRL